MLDPCLFSPSELIEDPGLRSDSGTSGIDPVLLALHGPLRAHYRELDRRVAEYHAGKKGTTGVTVIDRVESPREGSSNDEYSSSSSEVGEENDVGEQTGEGEGPGGVGAITEGIQSGELIRPTDDAVVLPKTMEKLPKEMGPSRDWSFSINVLSEFIKKNSVFRSLILPVVLGDSPEMFAGTGGRRDEAASIEAGPSTISAVLKGISGKASTDTERSKSAGPKDSLLPEDKAKKPPMRRIRDRRPAYDEMGNLIAKKRGRPPRERTQEEIDKAAEREAKISAGIPIKKGRPRKHPDRLVRDKRPRGSKMGGAGIESSMHDHSGTGGTEENPGDGDHEADGSNGYAPPSTSLTGSDGGGPRLGNLQAFVTELGSGTHAQIATLADMDGEPRLIEPIVETQMEDHDIIPLPQLMHGDQYGHDAMDAQHEQDMMDVDDVEGRMDIAQQLAMARTVADAIEAASQAQRTAEAERL